MKPSSLRLIGGALVYALAVILSTVALARALDFVPLGTRAQATGVCLTTLVLIGVGFVVGMRARRRTTHSRVHGGRILGLLSEMDSDDTGPSALRPFPARVVGWTSIFVCGLGLLGYFSSIGGLVLPPESIGEGGMAKAMLATNATLLGPSLFLSIGALLGVHTRAWTILAALGGFLFLVFISILGGHLARYASYDATAIAGLTVAGAMAGALGTGFLLAWVRQRLAFVELSIVSLLGGYTVFLVAGVGPEALTKASNLPEEQIFLALAVVPAIALFALLTVGSSVGFLLHGGGRFDPGFRYEAGVALRYLRAHGRDGLVGVVTKISVLGVMLGVTALVVVLSVMSGFENDLKRKILGAHAHVVVGKHGDDFVEYPEVEEAVGQLPGVNTAAAFILGDAMISTDSGLSGTLVKGIDPSSPGATKDLERNLTKGSLEYLRDPEKIPGARRRIDLPGESIPKEIGPVGSSPEGTGETGATGGRSGSARTSTRSFDFAVPAIREPLGLTRPLPGIIIGRELSKTLRAYVGDTVKLVSPVSEEIGPMGPTPKLRRFRVAGVFFSGMYEYDAKFTYIEMAQAQRFFGLRGRVTGIELKVDDIDDTATVVETLKRRLGGYPYTVRDWREMNKELFSALLLEKLAMFIGLTMIIMVASFLIVATLVMIVLQRGKEIAIMKSIGSSDASIMKVFVVQGVIVGVGGALLGVLLGLLLCLILGRVVSLDEKVFYIERLPVVIDWAEIAAIATCAVVISYLATIYPAMTAAQLRPVEGLRDD